MALGGNEAVYGDELVIGYFWLSGFLVKDNIVNDRYIYIYYIYIIYIYIIYIIYILYIIYIHIL